MAKQSHSSKVNSRFINDIERTIKIELSLIKKSDSQLLDDQRVFHDDVLRIFRNAFDSLLANMSTFKPLLLKIKEAYENSLSIRDKQIKSGKIILNAIKKERENSKITIEKLTEESAFLKEKIQEFLAEIDDLKMKNDKLRQDARADHLALSTERDARYTFFHENAKLKNEIQHLKNHTKIEVSQDPIVVKLALERCRKDLSKVTKQLNDVLQDYEDAIPKKKYEILENEFMGKCDEFNNLSKQLKILDEQHDNLLEEFKKAKEECDELKDKCSELERSGTPRPQWDICAEYIGGGITRWKLLTKGLSSKQRLGVILKELGPTSKENVEHFEGLGFDPIIPEYLQYEGQIRNLRLTQRDLSILINDVWNSKLIQGKELSMQDYLKIYFHERYQQPNIRAEWAYNLYSGCERMLDDPQMKLFWGVLHGNLSQDLYYAHKIEWEELKSKVVEEFENNQKKPSLEEVEKIFRKVFPLKSEVDLKNIMEIARKQLKVKNMSQEISTAKLFDANEEGFDRIELAKELFRQRRLAQEKYVKEIIIQLGGKKDFSKPISVETLKRAFAIIDPHIDHIIMESNIRWVFSDKKSNLNMIYPLTLKTVANKLMSGNIKRVGPRYRGKLSKVYKY